MAVVLGIANVALIIAQVENVRPALAVAPLVVAAVLGIANAALIIAQVENVRKAMAVAHQVVAVVLGIANVALVTAQVENVRPHVETLAILAHLITNVVQVTATVIESVAQICRRTAIDLLL